MNPLPATLATTLAVFAPRLNHVDAARVLIEAGADVELADGDGLTPRQHAHRRGHAAIERLLADAGAQ
ncbi:ankyrin repeat domain-containing protein [Dokdonella ginsengisoli]|uniref:Ankyrin repeat domain-containing protein n=1 Tax=Dokdonella ginsengisoli TaxID=363846 RepID=A0ABV9QWT5_9GAMM